MNLAGRCVTATIAVAVLAGTCARLVNLDRKVFFQDEAYAALRITGHTQEAYLRTFDGTIRSRDAVLAFVRLGAHSSPRATLSSIAAEEPQRGPLYYALAAAWVRFAGTSVVGFRSLSAGIGLLTIVAAYGLGRVLFANARAGAMLAALVAVSPFHIRYAQQAREYGLFTCVIFASTACLIVALRRSGAAWIAYAAACTLGLATSPLFALVIVSHAAYVLYVWSASRLPAADTGRAGVAEPLAPSPRLAAYAVATGAALAAMTPWFWYAARSAGTVADQTEWATAPFPAAFALTKWAFNTGATFFDYEFADVRFAAVLVVLLPIVVWAALRALRRERTATALALALGLPTLAAFLAKDASAHAHFATIPRYVTPLWIALELAVTAGLYDAVAAPSRRARRSGAFAFAFVIACGVWCAAADSPQQTWWDNNDNEPTTAVAEAINAAPRPLVATSNVAITLSLARYLRRDVRLRLHLRDAPSPELRHTRPSAGETYFYFLPSPREREALSRIAVLSNVSPRNDTVVGGFHAALQRDRPGAHSRSLVELSGPNALWEFVPQTHDR